eukprot:5621299-Amphidinium_carterae.1
MHLAGSPCKSVRLPNYFRNASVPDFGKIGPVQLTCILFESNGCTLHSMRLNATSYEQLLADMKAWGVCMFSKNVELRCAIDANLTTIFIVHSKHSVHLNQCCIVQQNNCP